MFRQGRMKTFDAQTPADWRQWLASHHDREAEVWLVFYRGPAPASITYEEAVNEALCFGWVDSLIKRIDDARYARKFTPRKADSKWSTANRRRYEQLKAAERLTPAGLQRPPTERSGDAPRPSEVPGFVRKALQERPAAEKVFEKLPPSHRRAYLGWIDSAKKEETKLRRLQQALEMLEAGKKLGLK